jgi:hypothetical protein
MDSDAAGVDQQDPRPWGDIEAFEVPQRSLAVLLPQTT